MSLQDQARQKVMAGRQVFGVSLRLVDDEGNVLPRDGRTSGSLQVRGLWVCSGYFGGKQSNGWFDTGDVATLDTCGSLQITDRTKDAIKSGGEWISSIEIENALMAHSDVAQAAVIGIYHPTWGERPFLLVVPRPSHSPTSSERAHCVSGGKNREVVVTHAS
ncbi:AMP-binding protein [Pseudomonas siliginis]|uniref:AMP-binding enzyme n=1 Tax=Pseudomonas siliginis TaxID=2842346 RepID=UPI002093F2A8|nr:AMP-binding protein [Pseudomonas siliginis]UST72297.1 AMP-binding protein [Pseudomonas siliginis]